MHITVIRHSIRNRGGDRLVLDYLAHLAGQGHAITYWTNEVNTVFPLHPKITIKKIPFPGVGGTILFALLNKFKTDILLVDLVVMALFAALRNKNKILYLAQDYDVTYHKSFFIRQFTHEAYRLILKTLGITTVAVSEGLAEVLKQYSPKCLITISNGIDLTIFQRNTQSPYLAQKQRPLSILFFARDDFRKGLDIAIKTIRELAVLAPEPTWEVWTIGSEKVQIEGIEIKNLGFIKNEKSLADILSATDIFLVPSRSEGLGLLLLQALACRCAIITTSASSIIQHEVTGLVSPIEDWQALAENLKRVLTDPELAARLKSASRPLAEQYDIQSSRRKFQAFIESFPHE